MFFILLAVILIFQVKKPSFVTDDSFDIILGVTDTVLRRESFIYSSIWLYSSMKINIALKRSFKLYLFLLILMSGDVEQLPGPQQHLELKSLLRNRGLSILHQNVRGLSSNFDLISEILENNNIDILTLSETHIKPSDDISEFNNIPGYNFRSSERKTGDGGGVGIYLSDRIDFERRKDLEFKNLESLVFEIFLKKSFLVCTIYRPPDNSDYLDINFVNVLDNMLSLATKNSKELMHGCLI